nr:CARDB domain-containing protein [uncultured Undibacterium sp.]
MTLNPRLIRFVSSISLILLSLFGWMHALADFPTTSSFPNSGFYQARHIKDKNDISIIQLTGNYDITTNEGQTNIEPRTVIAKEFYRTHPDNYDFIVIFSNFEFNTGDALAYHLGVQNKVKGIGIPEFDNTRQFGSAGKLLGYIDMAALSRYKTNPFSPDFESVLRTFSHEFMHQWGAKIRYKSSDGTLSTALLGKDGSHWSFLLNSGASVGYGNQWRDNLDGTFTSTAGYQFFSPLDLYLMGLYKKEEVPSFFLIDSANIDKTRLPSNGVTVTGIRRDISIDDVIAAEGPRIPTAENAQKEFRLGFVLLSRAGDEPTDAEIAALSGIRKAITTRLAVMTGGRAITHSYSELIPTGNDDPNNTQTGQVRSGGANVADGLNWLKEQQLSDGNWEDNPFTKVRDTAFAFETLFDLDGVGFIGKQKALMWLGAQRPDNTDYIARSLRALNSAGGSSPSQIEKLLSMQNVDGGWGVSFGYQSNPLDTALAILALRPFGANLVGSQLDRAINYLQISQNLDGGWGSFAGGVSRTTVSATVLQALSGRANASGISANVISFLARRQNPDGGFGDSPSTVHDTANVVLALLNQNALGSIRAADATSYVASMQLIDGSWNKSAYSTALALRLLRSSGLFNWTLTDLRTNLDSLPDGQQVVLSFKVSNDGTNVAPIGKVRVFDGDPATTGIQIGQDINFPALSVGAYLDLKVLWNTFGKAGGHTLHVVVDPENSIQEVSKSDNRQQIRIAVLEAPTPVDLIINASEFTVNPSYPNKLPSNFTVSGPVFNIGKTDALGVRVVLLEGDGPNAKVIDEKTLNLLGRTQQVINFSGTLVQSGISKYSVVIDPDRSVTEVDKTNNIAPITIETSPALDLDVRNNEIIVVRSPVYMGSDAQFKVKIRNAGTVDSPPFKVRYSVSNGVKSIEAGTRTIQLAAGSSIEQEFVWRAEFGGDLMLHVELDPENILTEIDKTNNTGQAGFKVIEANGSNLAVSFKDLIVTPLPPLERQELTVSQVIRNIGNLSASDIEVGFYDGDPSLGKLIVPIQKISNLNPGESVVAVAKWPLLPDAQERLIFVSVDPDKKQNEITREDNLAFTVITPLSMADLAISSADLVVSPSSPKPGDVVTVNVKLSNLGKQAARDLVVRLYDGDPAHNGKSIGPDQIIAALEGLESQTLTFVLPTSEGNLVRSLFAVVDPDNLVAEKNEENNTARRDLIVQDSSFYLVNRFFSPNGDGVKDDATMGFRLQSTHDVSVDVVNKYGKTVRTFTGEAFKNVQSGTVSWDGLTSLGIVAPDGEYRISVLDAKRLVLGEVKVTLDTNRLSIIDAIDTPFEQFNNLSCEIGNVQWNQQEKSLRVTADEERIFLANNGNYQTSPSFLRSFYRGLSNGSDLRPVLSSELLNLADWNTYFGMSLNGERLAFTRVQKVSDSGYQEQLWAVSGDGQVAKQIRALPQGSFDTSPGGSDLNSDGSAYIGKVNNTIQKIPTDGFSAETILLSAAEVGDGRLGDLIFSPDRNLILVPIYIDQRTDYFVINTVTGLRKRMSDTLPHIDFSIKKWAPNSRFFAMGSVLNQLGIGSTNRIDARIYVFDTEFNVVKLFQTKVENSDQASGNSDGDIANLEWSSTSTEFVFGHSICLENCRIQSIASRSTSQIYSGTTTGIGIGDGPQHVMVRVDLSLDKLEPVESTRLRTDQLSASSFVYAWVPNERTIIRQKDDGCKIDGENSCIDAVLLDDQNKIRPLFNQWHSGPEVAENNGFTKMRLQGFLPSGRKLMFASFRAAQDSSSSCYNSGPDQYSFGSLLNMTIDLQLLRSTSVGGLILRGTATDQNFSRYVIEYASVLTPNEWKTVVPSSSSPVVDGVFTNWVPPAFGNYYLRLTVEDSAGNQGQQIRRISWMDTPSITDLYKDTEFVSPNGDAIQDVLKLHYRVLDPVHLEFNVHDIGGAVIRTVSRDHFSIGQEAFFVWDGRDDFGRVVSDGKYRIAVQNYEFFVNIDNTPPQGTINFVSAFGFRIDPQTNDKNIAYVPMLAWSSSDQNYASMLTEQALGSVSGEWQEFGRFPQQKEKGQVLLNANDFVGAKYKITVADKAGSKISATAELGEQQVFFLNFAEHRRKNAPEDISWQPIFNIRYPEATNIGGLPSLAGLSGGAPVRLIVAETIRKSVTKVILQYREILEAEKSLPVTAVNQLSWQEMQVSTYLKFDASKNDFVSVGNKSPDNFFEFLWDLKGIKPQTDYLVRLKVIDEDNSEYVAMSPHTLRIQSNFSIVKIVDDRGSGGQSVLVDAQIVWSEPIVRSDFLISSKEDPRFFTERLVHTVLPPNGAFSHFVGSELLKELDLRSCDNYSIRLKGTTASGDVVHTLTESLQTRCLGVNWIAAPETSQSCDVSPASKIKFKLSPYSKDGRKLTQLLLGTYSIDGREEILNNWNDVTASDYNFSIDTTNFASGMRQYFVRVINEDGKKSTEIISIPVTHTAPVARISYPADGQKMCGVKARDPVELTKMLNVVAIEGSIASDSNVSYALEFGKGLNPPEWKTFSPAGVEKNRSGFSGLRQSANRLERFQVPPKFCAYPDSELCKDFHPIQWSSSSVSAQENFPGTPAVSGELGRLGLFENEQVEGDVSVRLRVFNAAGYQSCSAPVHFSLDNQLQLNPSSTDRKIFSAKATSLPDYVSLKIAPAESVSVDIRVFPGYLNARGETVVAGPSILSLAQAQSLIAGEYTYQWNGRTSGENIVNDGLYLLRTTYVDACGNSKDVDHAVELDSTPPVALITSPIRDAKLGLIAQINGSIRDVNFMSYTVQYALASNPDSWVTVVNGINQTPAEVSEQGLASWNTLGLAGLVNLRLVAQDSVGNVSLVSIPVEITSRADLISYLESVPAIFSPNADAKRDLAAIRYAFLSAAKARLDIFRDAPDGVLVKTLINDEVVSNGAAVKQWDGTNLGAQSERDGLYFAKLTATSLDNASVKQEVVTQLMLDNTAPKIAISYPKTDFVSAKGSVSYSVTDTYLDTFKVYFSTNPDGLNWQLAAEGATEQAAAIANSLNGLSEAKYGVKVVAVDKAENRTEMIRLFEIDNTPPKISFTAPINDSYLSAKKGLVKLSAGIVEKNLASYKLRYGQGNNFDSFSEITNGTSLISSELAMHWDISALLDGEYTLSLKVDDHAGQTNQSQLFVTIDNTAPVALIHSPLNSAYVKQGVDILGTASDSNFLEYKIEIAPGPKVSANRWSILSTSAVAVESGVLLKWQQMPADGMHTLKLTVIDKAGNITETLSEVIVDTVAPSSVTNLDVKLENRKDARLSWSSSKEVDIAGYAIYRNGTRINSELLKVTSYVDSSLENGTYSYTLKAIDKAGWESEISDSVVLVIDQSGPTAQIFTPGRGALVSALLDIKGSANSTAGMKEYRLYVGVGENPSAWQLLRRSSVPMIADVLGSWSTLGLPENSVQTLKLEVEDITGQVATDKVTVAVDNVSPVGPTQLVANANGDSVALSWTASSSSDVVGYILYRNERIANAAGAVIGSFRPYLIVTNNFVDLKVVDGVHTYVVQAMDKAENLSSSSNSATVTLDNRAPQALISKPSDGIKFDRSLYILATTADADIATVQFQYKSISEPAWVNFSTPISKLPYEINWDPTGLAYGDYLLRAVATDKNGHVDPSPATIRVSYKNLVVPDVVTGLKAQVAGGNVSLSWNPSVANDLVGYWVDRVDIDGKSTRLTSTPVTSSNALDENLPDASYRYRVYAVGTNDLISKPSADVTALVYTPEIIQPYTPTIDSSFVLTGRGMAGNKVLLAVNGISVSQFYPIGDGTFVKTDIPLSAGENLFELMQKDVDGNLSKSIQFRVVNTTAPKAPIGLQANSNGLSVTLNWTKNSEADIRAYRVLVNQANDDLAAINGSAAASSTSPYYYAEAVNAIDENLFTSWRPDPRFSEKGQWLSLTYAQEVTVKQVKVFSQSILTDYDIEAWDGIVWVPVAGIRGNTSVNVLTVLSRPYLTDKIRIKLIKSNSGEPMIDEVLVTVIPTQVATVWNGSVENGVNSFSVIAQNNVGIFSDPATITQVVGDVTPPDAVELLAEIEASSVTLTWTASKAGDLKAYEVFRDGISVAKIVDLNDRRFVDRDLPNGNYRYVVRALDISNNVSADSNIVTSNININIPSGPINLAIEVVGRGKALKLTWNAPATGPVPFSYEILRSNSSGGSYQVIARQGALTFVDEELRNDDIYFYVVTAIDKLGNVQIQSNEVGARPTDTLAPQAPVIFLPSVGGTSITSTNPMTSILGSAEPGATVSLVRNQAVLDVGSALKENVKKSLAISNDIDFYDLNTDGRRLALAGSELTLMNFDTGISKIVPGSDQPGSVAWTKDGETVGFTQYDRQSSRSVIYSYQDGQVSIRKESDLRIANHLFAWSPNGLSIAAVGEDDQNRQGLWLIDRATKNLRLLVAFNMWALHGQLVWSPNGKWIAYQKQGSLHVVNTDSAASYDITGGKESGFASWSTDSLRLLYQFRSDNGDPRLAEYRPDTNEVRIIGTEGDNNRYDLNPHFFPGAAGDYVTTESNKVLLRSSNGSLKSVLADDLKVSSDKVIVTAGGMILYPALSDSSDQALNRITLAGHFQFQSAKLNPGDNLFTVRAVDEKGNKSSDADPVRVILNVGSMPDIVAELGDITLLPNTPLVGEQSRLTVRVRNVGNLSASNFVVSVKIRAPDGGVVSLLDTSISSLAGGGSHTYSIDWTPTQAGAYSVTLALDTSNTVQESNEINNQTVRDFSVASSALPSIQVSTDTSVYGANSPLTIKLAVTNGGPLFSGKIMLVAEDENGILVSELGSVPVINLNFGETKQFTEKWNTGNIFAGNYRIVAKLLDSLNTSITNASTNFSVNLTQEVQANLVSDRTQYKSQQIVQLSGAVQLKSGSTLQNGVATLRILNAADEVVHQNVQVLSTLYAGTSTAVNFAWNLGEAPLGAYRAQLSVSSNSTKLSDTEISFEVVFEPQAQVEGNMTFDASGVAPGERVAIAYALRNIGNVPFLAIPVKLDIVDPDDGKLIAQFQTVVDLTVGVELKGSAQFDVNSWPIKALQIRLSTEIQGKPTILERSILRVVDRLAPAMTVISPQQSQIFNSNTTPLSVRAVDRDTRVAKVEYSIDGVQWNKLLSQNAGVDVFGLKLVDATDGSISLLLRATDVANNVSEPIRVDAQVDNLPPQVNVVGILDGGKYAGTVTPVIHIADANLNKTTVTLDGQVYVSGTPISTIGSHILKIIAEDKAVNVTTTAVQFLIGSRPRVELSSPNVGMFSRLPLTIVAIGSSDSFAITKVEYSISGGAWIEMQAHAAGQYQALLNGLIDGEHDVRLRAIDEIGQISDVNLNHIEIDNTVPVISVSGLIDGQIYTSAVVPVVSILDSNLLDSKILLDGEIYVSGTPIIKSGAHKLLIEATDKAGNLASKTIQFQVNLDIPLVTVVTPLSGSTVGMPSTLIATATSTSSTIAKVEYQVDGGAWSVMSPMNSQYQSVMTNIENGTHKVNVRAIDANGQLSSVVTVDFVVDSSALVGTITLSAQEVPLGDPVLLSFTATNSGNAALSNVPLKLSIIDVSTNKQVASYPYSISLAVGAKYSASTSWTTSGTVGDKYQVVLSAIVAGKDQVLAQNNFILTESKVKLSIIQNTAPWQNVLVYSACKRLADDFLGQCGTASIPVENPAALAVCDAGRVQVLDLYLNGLGVSHKVTSSPSVFLTDLRSGLYNAVWLSNGAVNIAEPAGAEIRAAILRGNGMMLDGMSDRHNRQLSQCGGITFNGKYTLPDQTLTMTGNLFSPGNFRITNSPIKMTAIDGGLPQAKMNITTPTDAIVSNQIGNGKTLTFGFDLEETLRTQSIDGRWLDVVGKGLDYLKSDAAIARDLSVGQVFSLGTTIKNEGKSLVLQVVQELPVGAMVVDLEPFGVVSNSSSGQLVTWTIEIAPNETKQVRTKIRAPGDAGDHLIKTTLNQVELSQTKKLQSQSFEIAVKNGTQLLNQLMSQVSLLIVTDPEKIATKAAVIQELSRTQLAMMASSHDEVLRRLLVVQSRLSKIDDADAKQSKLLARLIGIAEWQLVK